MIEPRARVLSVRQPTVSVCCSVSYVSKMRFEELLCVWLFCIANWCIDPSICESQDENSPWCILACHFRPNLEHNPEYHQLDVDDIPVEMCTHLIYESAVVGPDFVVKPRRAESEVYESGKRLYTWINKLKQRYANLVTLLAIDFPHSDEFHDWLAFHQSRAIIIESMISLIEPNNFDGLILNLPNSIATPSSYVNLARELNEKRKRKNDHEKAVPAWIGIAVKRRHAKQHAKMFAQMAWYLDFVILSSDEMNGTYTTYAVDPIRKVADVQTDDSIDSAVTALIDQGAPASKLVVGLSLHAHVFVLRDSQLSQVGAPATFDSPQLTSYAKICQQKATASADRLSVTKYGLLGRGRWMSFNDEEMIQMKTEWVQERGLRGIALSLINADDAAGKCRSDRGTFPLLRTAFDHLHCLDLTLPMYEGIALPHDSGKPKEAAETPCVRFCSIDQSRVNPDYDINPITDGSCTHVTIDANDEVDERLRLVVRTWKLKKTETTALLLTFDGSFLTAKEHFTADVYWLERKVRVVQDLGLDGVTVRISGRHGSVPLEIAYLTEQLHAKLRRIRNYGNGTKQLLVVSTDVDTLYTRQVDWMKVSKLADFLNVGGKADMMQADDFNKLIQDYGIDRRKVLLSVDTPVAPKGVDVYSNPKAAEEICQRFIVDPAVRGVEQGVWPSKYDTISTARQKVDIQMGAPKYMQPALVATGFKARLATMKNFAGVTLANLESDDPTGRCALGSSFPMLHTTMDNQLCGRDCLRGGSETLQCRKGWRVQCYYALDDAGLRRFLDSKRIFDKCTHLSIFGFNILPLAGGKLVLDVSPELRTFVNDLNKLRQSSHLKLIAVVKTPSWYSAIGRPVDLRWKTETVENIAKEIVKLNVDGVEFQLGPISDFGQRQDWTHLLRLLRGRLGQLSANRMCPLEMSVAVETQILERKDYAAVEQISNIFDHVTLLSFKHRPTSKPAPGGIYNIHPSDLMDSLPIDDVINLSAKAGLPAGQIVLALPLFGSMYQLPEDSPFPVPKGKEFRLAQHLKYYEPTRYSGMREICKGIVKNRMRKGICLDQIIAFAYVGRQLYVHESPETMLLKASSLCEIEKFVRRCVAHAQHGRRWSRVHRRAVSNVVGRLVGLQVKRKL
ncbi:glycosyl hydrolase, family 18 [Trichuris suis]|nr:glycosyl hydrolase, family 18 [Trichuris suis]